jgi:hypothetical protein
VSFISYQLNQKNIIVTLTFSLLQKDTPKDMAFFCKHTIEKISFTITQLIRYIFLGDLVRANCLNTYQIAQKDVSNQLRNSKANLFNSMFTKEILESVIHLVRANCLNTIAKNLNTCGDVKLVVVRFLSS